MVGLNSLLTFPLLWHVTTAGFGLLKPKVGSVFHHGRLSCKITDEQGLSKQAAGDSSLDLSSESRNELGQGLLRALEQRVHVVPVFSPIK